jgi:hypothetical protein
MEYLGAGGPVPNNMRDARIVELRRSGWTLAAIAEEWACRVRRR